MFNYNNTSHKQWISLHFSGLLEMEMATTPVFLPGKSHGWGAWQATVHGITESDMTERLHFSGLL